MEDRIEAAYGERQGFALIALVVVIAITAAWWALALWPVGAEAEWLARTRAACFGSVRGGLPNSGGWILLIGEPIGMFGALLALWGQSLKRDLAWLCGRHWGKVAVTAVVLTSTAAIVAAGVRVARALPTYPAASVLEGTARVSVNRPAPRVALVDQYGRDASLRAPDGRPALLTFAFGHCETVCPAIVSQLRSRPERAGGERTRIIILTLDPWRDTPERLPSLARQWQLAPGDLVLSGTVTQVCAALDSLGIGRQRDRDTGDIEHAAIVMFIDAAGNIAWRAEAG